MKDVSQPLRDSYLTKLSGLAWPVYDEDVNDTYPPYSREDKPPAYILITNQYENTNSNKCSHNSEAFIQLDCVTWQDSFSTSKVQAEAMSNAIGLAIFGSLQADFSDMLPDFNVWQGRIVQRRFIIEHLGTQTVVRKIIIISHQIQEL